MIAAIVAIPFLLVIVLFALSNQQSQVFTLWPTDLSVELPLSLAVLGVALAFFVAGGLLAWGSVLRLRGKLRRAQRTAKALEDQLAVARAEAASPRLSSPESSPARRDLALSPPS